MKTAQAMPPKLYAPREPIFPRSIAGRFRTLKWHLLAATLGIYYLTPWIRWDRGPKLPDQAVLVDIASRRFFFFWIEIWPHEFYFVGGLLIMAGIGLFLFTSVLGRVWCGFACPQTIWTDLFILVERLIRRRPEQTGQTLERSDVVPESPDSDGEMDDLAGDFLSDRRGLGLLFHGRPDPRRGSDRA